MRPDGRDIKDEFIKLTTATFSFDDLTNWLKENLSMGSIDVNIMTKVDRTNYFKKEELPSEYNDAHAALRGYANSDLSSSVILTIVTFSSDKILLALLSHKTLLPSNIRLVVGE